MNLFSRLFQRKPKPGHLSEADRIALLTRRMHWFSDYMREERRKRGHIVYREGVSISPSAWPACPPDCEHVRD